MTASETVIGRASQPTHPTDEQRPLHPLLILAGNPNTGKTTLFNLLTGQNARVGNYPGVTVERRSGHLELELSPGNQTRVEVVDAPGAYSLSARSGEEQIALEAIVGLSNYPTPDLCIVVVDAGQLSRNLYLLLQIAEFGVPLIVALNMIDEVKDNPPDADTLARLLGVPVVATNARSGAGLQNLRSAIAHALQHPSRPTIDIQYPEGLRHDQAQVLAALPESWRNTTPERARALALWALGSIDGTDELTGIPNPLREVCLSARSNANNRDIDLELIVPRYAYIDNLIPRLYKSSQRHATQHPISERIDRILLHPVYGFGIFALLMLLVFQSLFSWSDPAISLIESSMGLLSKAVVALLPAGLLRDLVTDGVIGGVGNVLVFLPQILLLFLFVGLLEDSGYMARAAYLMDRIMKALGLHGRAFVPMLSGFACAVPAIMATRTMERQRDRLLTMLVVPLMTCSARLPVYTLIIGAVIPPRHIAGIVPLQGLMMVGMYFFSMVITLVAAGVLGRTVVRGRRMPLILELPPYRRPSLAVIYKQVKERAGIFLKEAGSVILLCTVVLWALLAFPRTQSLSQTEVSGQTSAYEVPVSAKPVLENTYGGKIGKAIEPLIHPLGFDWKIGVGLVGAFAAREVFVSTLGLVYGIEDTDNNAVSLRDKIRSERRVDGTAVYTPLTGLSLMLFFALSCQCMSTLAVVRRETRTWRWPAFLLAYMTGLAYITSLIVYQGGRLLGF